MKKKRITNDDPSINFRVPLSLKNKIEEVAQNRNLTTSGYLRELLERIHDGTYCNEELERRKRESFLFSKEFMQLVIWIYKKRQDKLVKENKEQLEKYIAVLKKAGDNLTKELNDEFDKVLLNLIEYVKSEPRSYSKYDFIDSYDENKKFNFELLEHIFLDNDILESVIVDGFSVSFQA